MEDIIDVINNLLTVQPKKKHTLQHWHKKTSYKCKNYQLIHLTLGPPVKNKRFLSTLDSQWISYTIWRRIKYRYTPKGSRFACIFVHTCQGYAITGPEGLRKNSHCSNPCACWDIPIRSSDELQNAPWPARPECM